MADAADAMNPDQVDILIVDDLPDKRLVLQTILQDLGQNLVLARSGAEALREILKREFALILMDVNMPDIDGLETAGLIRKYKKSAATPIIFITAFADEIQTLRGYQLGAVDYIFSPVIPDVLRSKVKVFVELHRMQRRIREQAEERIARIQAEAAQRAAEESVRRSAFLVRASHELGGLLERGGAARRLLEMVVPEMAPLAALLLPDARTPYGVPELHVAVAAGEAPRFLPEAVIPPALAAEMLKTVSDGSAANFGAEVLAAEPGMDRGWPSDLRGGVALPLLFGGRCLGALALGSAGHGGFGLQDLSMFEELASRAAIAFENARLYSNLQREVAERQEAEQKLEQESRRKDEFLAMLSHELRNPMAPIRNAVEVMRRTAPGDPAQAWARDIIGRQITHLTRLVEELLDVARIAQGKISLSIEPVRLAAVLEQAVETARPLIDASKHELRLRLPPPPLTVPGDFARLAQVVGNLLNNAAKYTARGGVIELGAAAQGEEVAISVRDNGIGIDAELLPQVFDLFTQGKQSLDRSQGGLGIGLTLVRKLVELHGGRVEARSGGPGQGSEFRIHLPRSVPGAAGLDAQPALAAAGQGKRILVVDDNPDTAQTIATVLSLEGHELRTAADGFEAFECARGFRPEVIVLDIGLPRLSGYDIARELRRDPQMQETLLIALTGYGQPSDVAKAEASGFDLHFIKPVEPQRILEVIAAGLPQRRPWRQLLAPPRS
jgi:signal transduction histidine kinase